MSRPNPTKRDLAALRPLVNDAHRASPDEFGEVPLDMFPSSRQRQYVTPCGHKIQADDREAELNQLHETNVQIYHAFANVCREARDLRRALRRSQSETVTACLAGLALLVITILGMRL